MEDGKMPPNAGTALMKLEAYKQQNPEFEEDVNKVIENIKAVENGMEYEQIASILSDVSVSGKFSTLPGSEDTVKYLKDYLELEGMKRKLK